MAKETIKSLKVQIETLKQENENLKSRTLDEIVDEKLQELRDRIEEVDSRFDDLQETA